MLVHKPPSGHVAKRFRETRAVRDLAAIEAESLLVHVAEQMERFDADIGALKTTLEQRPKILNSVRVDIALNVGFGVVNDLVRIVRFEATVTNPCIGEHLGPRFYVVADRVVKRVALDVADNARLDAAMLVRPVTFE